MNLSRDYAGGFTNTVKIYQIKNMENSNEIDYKIVEKVCHDFSKVLEDVCSDPMVRFKYPAIHYPESLLPYPKSVISFALNIWKEFAEKKNDKSTVNLLEEMITVHLPSFVPDDEAKSLNLNLLTSDICLKLSFSKKFPQGEEKGSGTFSE